jgi:hypothetical protein
VAVERFRNRRDTIVLIGPLDELYVAAGPEIADYLSKGWTFEKSQTHPNAGPKMELVFTKERE